MERFFGKGILIKRFFNSNDGYGNGRYDSLGEIKKVLNRVPLLPKSDQHYLTSFFMLLFADVRTHILLHYDSRGGFCVVY